MNRHVKDRLKLNRKNFIKLNVIFLFIITFGIAQDTLWTRHFDLGRDAYANDIIKDIYGDIIIVGSLMDTTATDDILLLKYNHNGDLLWYRLFDNGRNEIGLCVTTDRTGNIIVGGNHYDDYTIEIPGITKFSPTGETIWTRIYPQLANFYIIGIALDTQNNIYGCGGHRFNPIAVIIKCDAGGNLLWQRFYTSVRRPLFYDLKVNVNGEIFISGDTDPFLLCAKFNNNGDSVWTRYFSAPGGYHCTGGMRMTLDNQGNIVIAGYATDWSNYDALIIKYSQTGNMVWYRILNYQLMDYLLDIGVDDYNNIFASGSSGIWDSLDYLLVKLSPSGETLWTRFYNSGYDDISGSVVVDNQNNPIITGSSSNGSNYGVLTIKYCGTTGIEESVIHQSQRRLGIKVKVLSNPCKNRCVLVLNIFPKADALLDIFDTAGRIKKSIKLENIYKRYYRMNLEVSDLPAGVYFIRLKQGKEQLTERLVIVK